MELILHFIPAYIRKGGFREKLKYTPEWGIRMKGKQLLTLGLAVFVITAVIATAGMENRGSKDFQISESDVGKLCLSGALVTGSRGTERQEEQGETGQSGQQIEGAGQTADGTEIQGTQNTESQGTDLQETDGSQGQGEQSTSQIVDTQNPENPSPQTINIDGSKPLVIIYHTHATESYQPASEGNFHTVAEDATVREVGNVLTAELQKLGIEVVHDKTIHDNPSYNQSYSRSLETVNSLLNK